jgi:hypothetical protein
MFNAFTRGCSGCSKLFLPLTRSAKRYKVKVKAPGRFGRSQLKYTEVAKKAKSHNRRFVRKLRSGFKTTFLEMNGARFYKRKSTLK